MIVKWVKIGPEVDGVDALYIDGSLVTHGDYYHDKISEYIDGFLSGMKYQGWLGNYSLLELHHEHPVATEIVEQGGEVPDSLFNLPLDDMTEEAKFH